MPLVMRFGLTGLGEDFFCGPKAIGLGHPDRQPDHAQQHVDDHEAHGDLEDGGIQSRRQAIDSNCDDKDDFGDGPDHSPPADVLVADPTGKVHLPDSELRDQIIRGGLRKTKRWSGIR